MPAINKFLSLKQAVAKSTRQPPCKPSLLLNKRSLNRGELLRHYMIWFPAYCSHVYKGVTNSVETLHLTSWSILLVHKVRGWSDFIGEINSSSLFCNHSFIQLLVFNFLQTSSSLGLVPLSLHSYKYATNCEGITPLAKQLPAMCLAKLAGM